MNEKQNLLDLRQVKVYLAEKVTFIVSLMDRSRHFFRYFRLGFEPWNFDVGSNHSTIWATTCHCSNTFSADPQCQKQPLYHCHCRNLKGFEKVFHTHCTFFLGGEGSSYFKTLFRTSFHENFILINQQKLFGLKCLRIISSRREKNSLNNCSRN